MAYSSAIQKTVSSRFFLPLSNRNVRLKQIRDIFFGAWYTWCTSKVMKGVLVIPRRGCSIFYEFSEHLTQGAGWISHHHHPKQRIRRRSIAQRHPHFCALALKQLCIVKISDQPVFPSHLGRSWTNQIDQIDQNRSDRSESIKSIRIDQKKENKWPQKCITHAVEYDWTTCHPIKSRG